MNQRKLPRRVQYAGDLTWRGSVRQGGGSSISSVVRSKSCDSAVYCRDSHVNHDNTQQLQLDFEHEPDSRLAWILRLSLCLTHSVVFLVCIRHSKVFMMEEKCRRDPFTFSILVGSRRIWLWTWRVMDNPITVWTANVRPTHPYTQWVLGLLQGKISRNVKLATDTNVSCVV
jgi:hypothetical protein